ncbi:hypothetical protein ACN08Y_09990 [Rothia sp. P5764]|uniref:hypothetical protein n=1 Tax=Rothia sp. P5764 TaxID=3402654 RepID=UPI003ACD8DCE
MASTFRQRATPTNIDAFIEAAEAPRVTASSRVDSGQNTKESEETPEARLERRAAGRKYSLYTLRGTEAQAELLKYSAKKKGMSQNELISHYLFEAIEFEFGADVPIK